MKNKITSFTNKYQLTKTLRFELIPQGRTLEHIQTKGIINRDENRARSYEKMKSTIDAFHKDFIERAMSQVRLTQLQDFFDFYFASQDKKKEDTFTTAFEKLKESLRKEIVKGFSADAMKADFAILDKKELITQKLENWIANQSKQDLYFDEEFKTFTTYFGGFHENRRNLYTDKPQSTAIAYRLIHENLPKFLDNIKIFEKIKELPELNEKCVVLYKEVEEYLNVNSIDEFFELNYYNNVLTQTQIEVYNMIIGGRTDKDEKRKIQGLNEYINLYNQGLTDKSAKLPKLKQLFKQILSDRVNTSFLPDAFEDDELSSSSQKVLNSIKGFYRDHLANFSENPHESSAPLLFRLKELLSSLNGFDVYKIHVKNDSKLTAISQVVFGQYNVFVEALDFYYRTHLFTNFESELAKASDKKREKLEKEKRKFTGQTFFSIGFLQNVVESYVQSLDSSHILKEKEHAQCLENYFARFSKNIESQFEIVSEDFIDTVDKAYRPIEDLLNTPYPGGRRLNQQQSEIDRLKIFLDCVMEVLHFIKPLHVSSDSALERDERFYGTFESYYHKLEAIVPLYNKVRNYATQRSYSIEKVKLNFENPQLLDGWPLKREIATSSLIFRDNGIYYLGILDAETKKYFKNLPQGNSDEDQIEKMIYQQAADPSKDVQNLIVINGKTEKKNGRKEDSGEFYGENIKLENLKNQYLPQEINTIRKERSYSTASENFSKESLRIFIDYYKQRAIEYFDSYNFNFKETSEYRDFSEFTSHINSQAYQVEFANISRSYIDDLVDKGNLYLFKIHNKDFSPYSKGRPNMHTLYWKALFDPNNLRDVVYKLNGGAEMFYRRASIERSNQVVHLANYSIKNKNPRNPKTESVFAYDLIKNRRFVVDKFQFHVPITLNFKAEGSEVINSDVRQFLQLNPEVNIIGLDRGERHLIYLTLINQKGEILKQISLNDIVNEYKTNTGQKVEVVTPYHDLLASKELDRAKARENWSTIETIKELKEGYLSQVVHVIAKMMVEYNAIVVMEDLNTGFKRGRFKVERQVYQKLEKMLIDKLNYLIFKDKDSFESGGVYKALQLTNKFRSFKEIGKQCGFLFYVPAWNTSKIDPTTGFVNFFDTRYESVEKTRDFFEKFKSIHFSSSKGYFEFHFDYNHFTGKAEGTRTEWSVCSYGERILTFRNSEKASQWDNRTVMLTEELEDLFGTYKITYGDQRDLREQIISQTDKKFFVQLMHLFRLIMQIRNSITNSNIDYLISPVLSEKTGAFYDSRKAKSGLPKDADANGAYHIALKGLYWLNQIHTFNGDDLGKIKFDTTNKGWLQFAQR